MGLSDWSDGWALNKQIKKHKKMQKEVVTMGLEPMTNGLLDQRYHRDWAKISVEEKDVYLPGNRSRNVVFVFSKNSRSL